MNAIEVRDVFKVYRLYAKPIDRLKEAVLRRPRHQEFQPLQRLSFSVPAGGTLGVVGENGAGKSTLLKILAGTLTPTAGEVVRRGRVAALLELGAGFHPEFTGRQNIDLNATLLGLTPQEIKDREGDIIAFAELGEFIDRPIKTYSSGMKVRLGFSIATSVDPDILIIDEALSVGDQRFQKKCVDRMMKFRESGKTIIFCSHSMYLVKELCSQALWLAQGRAQHYGPTADVISDYLAYVENQTTEPSQAGNAPAQGAAVQEVAIDDITVVDPTGRPLQALEQSTPVTVRVTTRRSGDPREGHVGVGLMKPDGQLLFGASTKDAGRGPIIFSGRQTTELRIPSLPLRSGTYRVKAVTTDEYALCAYDEYTTQPYAVISASPERGMLLIDHTWCFPGE